MAVAILLLIANHAKPMITFEPLRIPLSYLYCAVDIFFFCSGIGCWFSYTSDRNTGAFLKRRFMRIFPVYFTFMLYWLYTTAQSGTITLSSALANLFGLQWLSGRTPVFNWYLSGLWVIYLGTPYFAALAEKASTRLWGALAVLGLLLLSYLFWDSYYLIIIMARLPIFFVGMLLAAESTRRTALTKGETALLLLLVPLGAAILWKAGSLPESILWDRGMYWYPFLLIIPGFCIMIAYIARALERFSPGRTALTALSFVGGYTFEAFLTHYSALGHGLLHYLVFTVIYAAILHLASRVMHKIFMLLGKELKKLPI